MSQHVGSITPETVRKSIPKPITVFQEGDGSIGHELIRIEQFKEVLDPNNNRFALGDLNTLKRLKRLDAYQVLLEGKPVFGKGEDSDYYTYSYSDFLEEFEGIGLYVEEEFASSTSQVSRIGLDLSLKGLDDARRQEIHDKLTQIKIETTDAISVALSASTGASSGRANDSPHILHPLEVCRIRDAIKIALENHQRCVVTDIFAREDNGDFKFEDDNGVKVPEIHTILLYLQQDQKKVLVIDPNNSSFSKHLIYNSDIILGVVGIDMEICASKRDIQIYTPPTKESGLKTGPLLQHRDCTDIAVKLGLAMSECREDLLDTGDFKELKNLIIIKAISNNSAFNRDIFFDGQEECARVFQATETEVRQKAYSLMLGISRLNKFATQICKNKNASDIIKKEALVVLNISHNESDYYQDDLMRLGEEYKKSLELIGDIATKEVS